MKKFTRIGFIAAVMAITSISFGAARAKPTIVDDTPPAPVASAPASAAPAPAPVAPAPAVAPSTTADDLVKGCLNKLTNGKPLCDVIAECMREKAKKAPPVKFVCDASGGEIKQVGNDCACVDETQVAVAMAGRISTRVCVAKGKALASLDARTKALESLGNLTADEAKKVRELLAGAKNGDAADAQRASDFVDAGLNDRVARLEGRVDGVEKRVTALESKPQGNALDVQALASGHRFSLAALGEVGKRGDLGVFGGTGLRGEWEYRLASASDPDPGMGFYLGAGIMPWVSNGKTGDGFLPFVSTGARIGKRTSWLVFDLGVRAELWNSYKPNGWRPCDACQPVSSSQRGLVVGGEAAPRITFSDSSPFYIRAPLFVGSGSTTYVEGSQVHNPTGLVLSGSLEVGFGF